MYLIDTAHALLFPFFVSSVSGGTAEQSKEE